MAVACLLLLLKALSVVSLTVEPRKDQHAVLFDARSTPMEIGEDIKAFLKSTKRTMDSTFESLNYTVASDLI